MNRIYITYGILIVGISTGLLNMDVGVITALAEIIQFLCLFSLISISNYPIQIVQLFNSQSFLNFNFIPSYFADFLHCDDFQKEHLLRGSNVINHPSYNCNLLFCNLLSTCFLIILTIFFYLLAKIIITIIGKKLILKLIWEGLTSILIGDFINILVIIFCQIFFVILNRDFMNRIL